VPSLIPSPDRVTTDALPCAIPSNSAAADSLLSRLCRVSPPRTSTPSQARQHVGTWIEPEVVRELEERAEQADRFRSAELRIAIRRYLERTRFAASREPHPRRSSGQGRRGRRRRAMTSRSKANCSATRVLVPRDAGRARPSRRRHRSRRRAARCRSRMVNPSGASVARRPVLFRVIAGVLPSMATPPGPRITV
jgi:hypothetical protein